MEADGIGARVRRIEDPALVQGKGRYVGDLVFPGMLHAGFVRSPYAHARLGGIALDAARRVPGIVGAWSAGELPEVSRPTSAPRYPPQVKGRGIFPLARDTVRYAGEPVVVVLAEEPYALADAIDAVAVDYQPLPPVVDLRRATEDGALVWEDIPGNLALEMTTSFGDVAGAFQAADVVIEEEVIFARAAPAAMEPRAVAAVPDSDGFRLTIWDSTQAPHAVRDALTEYLGLDDGEVRVIVPDVGGGFGPKGRVYQEEYVVAALALRTGRPVRFVATRTEDLQTTAHGRGQLHRVQLAARSNGTILGLRDEITQDVGAYTPSGVPKVMNTVRHLMGPYRVPALQANVRGVYTNKVPTSPLRGGGRPQGTFVMERMLDRLAARLGIDRAEIRRRNFIPPEAFPYDTGMPSAGGATVVYDSGNFPEYMEKALEAIGYAEFPGRQARALARGRYVGLGLAAFIESTGAGSEGARVEIGDDGGVRVWVGSPSTGQGHATAFAQVAAQRLGVPAETVQVSSGDTAKFSWGTGTFASRMAVFGGNAVAQAARETRRKVLALAAEMIEIAAADLEIAGGEITVKGVTGRGMPLAEVAREARRRGEPLEASAAFQPEHQSAWAGGVNAAIVEVDVETGKIAVERYVVVHDAGVIINPAIVEGQIHGGVAHGLGNALLEECVYDATGQLAGSTLLDYTIPSAGDVPAIAIQHVETPSPFNPEGIKGAGEGGTIAGIPTLVSAVENALAPLGVKVTEIPIRTEWIARRY